MLSKKGESACINSLCSYPVFMFTAGICASLIINVSAAFAQDELSDQTLYQSHTPHYFLQLRQLYSQAQENWPLAQTNKSRAPAPLAPLEAKLPLPNKHKAALGKKLFFDPILSRDNTVSCSSCHEPRLQFGDKRTTAIGIDAQKGSRNTPNIFAIDHWDSFFWDGRASTADQQALIPIHDPKEMDLSISDALHKINTSDAYQTFIEAAFTKDTLQASDLASALVNFQRTITPLETPYSTFINEVATQPEKAISELNDAELEGFHLFRTKAKCMTCHEGALLSDNQFHGTGLHFYGRRFQDLGRYNVTSDAKDVGKFRTPSLLMVSQTGPWMHNGLFDDFSGIINFYNAGGARPKPRAHVKDDPLYPETSELLRPLSLTKQEREDLLAFLLIL